jgi:GTP-binding protein
MKISSSEFIKSVVKKQDYPAGKLPEIALAGRSNVGKSSLLNKLLNRRGLARTSKTPGRTRMINFFLVNGCFHLVDLPGYGYAKVSAREREGWRKMVEGYLKSRSNLKGMVLLVDSRHPPTVLDVQMYDWLKFYRIPTVIVGTKADKLSRSRLIKSVETIRKTLPVSNQDRLVLFSAETGLGREELLEIISAWVNITGNE